MTPEEQAKITASMHRFRANRLRMMAAWEDLNATAAEAAIPLAAFVKTLKEAEAREIAEHPDLAELNVQLDGYYEQG